MDKKQIIRDLIESASEHINDIISSDSKGSKSRELANVLATYIDISARNNIAVIVTFKDMESIDDEETNT